MDSRIDLGEDWWKSAGQKNIKEYYSRIYRGFKFNVRAPVLEIGGGSGTFLKYIGVNDATIYDLAGKDSIVGEYNFVRGDITKKIKLNQKFKTIFLMETLEHIKNPLYLLAQVYDILEDDGICYIGVPYTPLDLERKKEKNPLNAHVCRWKHYELKDQLEKLGFNVKFLIKRRRFKDTAFYLPHCFLLVRVTKRLNH